MIWGEPEVYIEPNPPLMQLTNEEFCEICKTLNWEFPNEKIEHISQLKLKGSRLFRYENDFLDTWGHTKENVALFRNYSEFDFEMDFDVYEQICISRDWKFPIEKEKHIDELRKMDRDLHGSVDDFLKRWGHTKENLAIFRYYSSFYSAHYDWYDKNSNNDSGFDDWDIIRRIQDGDGDMYGY